MKEITAEKNQTIHDPTVQYCGNREAVGEILSLNPDIVNGGTVAGDSPDFSFDLPAKATGLSSMMKAG
ncbi:hypothetical protein Barb6_00766 [Bacteroidales bacterium Barb6]|nr:hypothetical protein Barb6_00766 [Bacteroidales bacterium Barb6]